MFEEVNKIMNMKEFQVISSTVNEERQERYNIFKNEILKVYPDMSEEMIEILYKRHI